MKYLVLILGLCCMFVLKADIQEVSRKDDREIKLLFDRLIFAHDFGYTIFGSKPMSLADMCLEVPSNLTLYGRVRAKARLAPSIRRLNAWYRNKHHFVFRDFIFLDEEKDLINCLVLILINKKNMLRILHEYESIFKEELGDTFTPEFFLEKLEKREVSFAEATHKSQKLLGIMLGYGVRNATLFQDRFDLQKEIHTHKKLNLPEDEELTAKLNAIELQVGCFSELDADAIVHPLYFLADVSHPESIELKQKYEEERKQIIELRKKYDFMDLVLKRLVAAE